MKESETLTVENTEEISVFNALFGFTLMMMEYVQVSIQIVQHGIQQENAQAAMMATKLLEDIVLYK